MSGKKELIAVREIDYKGRITIPMKIRKHVRYTISYDGKTVFLEGVS